VFVDLDCFKAVNDTHGHDAGDQVLVQAARRLVEAVRPADTVARLGGDEFVVLCEDLTRGKSAVRLTDRVAADLEQPFTVVDADGDQVSVGDGASVGIVLSGGFDTTSDLLRRADDAMYAAKRARAARRVRALGPPDAAAAAG